jgi:hypothetical protein
MSRADELIRAALASHLASAEFRFEIDLSHAESPIEKVFLATLITDAHFDAEHGALERDRVVDMIDAHGLGPTPKDGREYHFFFTTCADARMVAVLQPTLVLEDRRMRPDFVLFSGVQRDVRLVVELDGHDFHERTPEQAERDKSKDRLLQKYGWRVLRFTGREVLRDPVKCVEEAKQSLLDAIRSWYAEHGVGEIRTWFEREGAAK